VHIGAQDGVKPFPPIVFFRPLIAPPAAGMHEASKPGRHGYVPVPAGPWVVLSKTVFLPPPLFPYDFKQREADGDITIRPHACRNS